jgi:hypothetical protein
VLSASSMTREKDMPNAISTHTSTFDRRCATRVASLKAAFPAVPLAGNSSVRDDQNSADLNRSPMAVSCAKGTSTPFCCGPDSVRRPMGFVVPRMAPSFVYLSH